MAQQKLQCILVLCLLVLINVSVPKVLCLGYGEGECISAVGDPGMTRDGLRLAIEGWNQCNEVGEEVPNMGSPRAADCFDVYKASPSLSEGQGFFYAFLILSLSISITSFCPHGLLLRRHDGSVL